MTKNKIKRKDLTIKFDKVVPNKENKNDPEPYKEKIHELAVVLESETMISLEHMYGCESQKLIHRNIICAINALSYLKTGNYKDAWFEMTDILDYHKDNEYLSENEVAVLYIVARIFDEEINPEFYE